MNHWPLLLPLDYLLKLVGVEGQLLVIIPIIRTFGELLPFLFDPSFSFDLRFFFFRCFLTSSWSSGNKAFTELSTSSWIVSDSNNSSCISSFSALLRIFCHFMWKSSLTGTIAGAFLMRSPNGVTLFERLSLKLWRWCS